MDRHKHTRVIHDMKTTLLHVRTDQHVHMTRRDLMWCQAGVRQINGGITVCFERSEMKITRVCVRVSYVGHVCHVCGYSRCCFIALELRPCFNDSHHMNLDSWTHTYWHPAASLSTFTCVQICWWWCFNLFSSPPEILITFHPACVNTQLLHVKLDSLLACVCSSH